MIHPVITSVERRRNDVNGGIGRAWLSLDGLSVGGAFGERFFGPIDEVKRRISRRDLPDAPWTYTDDTEMALSIVETLLQQNLLAARFAQRSRALDALLQRLHEVDNDNVANHGWA
jgi:ADP-ribosylglycohydrolase